MLAKTLHMIGNAHLDPVWLWRSQEGFHEALATFRSALDRMTEDDGFVFTSSSAALYEWVGSVAPGMLDEIRGRVTEGRWRIVGGWWIQPDCNIPCGESYARQALYGQRFFREKLGVTATVGYNPDSFGHNAMLPQILAKSGMDSYLFMRPGPHEKDLPGHIFRWASPDGSEVTAYRIPYTYCTSPEQLPEHLARCRALEQDGIDEFMCFYGVGNHGGGPTKENLRLIAEEAASSTETTIVHSSPDDYFRAIRGADLPLVNDDLQIHAPGCFAAHSGIKRWNRIAENRLLGAEKISTLANWIAEFDYPKDLGRAWKNVLFNQFHDILAGTSLEEAYEDARNDYGEAIAIADRALGAAAVGIAWKTNLRPVDNCLPVVVFNPNAWPVRRVVEFETDTNHAPSVMVAPDGNRSVVQAVLPQASVVFRKRIAFVAELPALGYRAFWGLAEPEQAPPTEVSGWRGGMSAEADSGSADIENEYLRLSVDPATGFITLLDKRTGVTIVRDGAAPCVIADDSDTWSHGRVRFDDEFGRFAVTGISLEEAGPVRWTLRLESGWGSSTLVQRFSLAAGIPRVDVAVTVDWHEHHQMLKLRFPTGITDGVVTYEIPYGSMVRPADGNEKPGQSWVDISGAGAGLCLLNDGKYSYSAEGDTLSLTVLRSPVYAHHDPYVLDPVLPYAWQDQGVQSFMYSLLPHGGDWRAAHPHREAAELNQPPVVQIATFHEGTMPTEYSLATIEPANVILTVLKVAEDGSGIVLRLVETDGMACRAAITFNWGRTIEADFGPYEIKTILVPDDSDEDWVETNLLETPL
ncbi:MAG TPA: glycoside hydrolase family 38 C-terminal domain-containing protein [Armatimonadota bacterium]|jgi:alpha-mannosidase